MTDLAAPPPISVEELEEPIITVRRARQHERDWYKANYPFLTCQTVLTGEINPNDVIAALHVTGCNVAAAGSILGISRQRLRDFIEKTPTLSQFYWNYRESLLDAVETTVFEQALAGDAGQARFLLTTLGKNRGYTTKNETETTVRADASLDGLLERIAQAGKPLVNRVDYTDVTEDPPEGPVLDEGDDDRYGPGPESDPLLEDE